MTEDGTWHPVAFESKKLNPAQANYPTHERELLGLVHCLKNWRHYLFGRQFNAYTDHKTLIHLESQLDLTGRKAHWSTTLQEFDVTICYQEGAKNIVADALSRRPDL